MQLPSLEFQQSWSEQFQQTLWNSSDEAGWNRLLYLILHTAVTGIAMG